MIQAYTLFLTLPGARQEPAGRPIVDGGRHPHTHPAEWPPGLQWARGNGLQWRAGLPALKSGPTLSSRKMALQLFSAAAPAGTDVVAATPVALSPGRWRAWPGPGALPPARPGAATSHCSWRWRPPGGTEHRDRLSGESLGCACGSACRPA